MLFSRSLAPALRATALRATARVAVRPSAAPAMQLQKRMFGHSDFDPISTADSSKSAIEQIEHDVKSNPVMLYMKGVPAAPQCGFSNRVVRVLEAYGVDFESANVLADEDLRVSIKEFSDWPTIPQLYVNGEFVGGCDIIMAMHESDELTDLFETAKA